MTLYTLYLSKPTLNYPISLIFYPLNLPQVFISLSYGIPRHPTKLGSTEINF